ncbi:hypothetical protein QMT40_002488 [Parvibaculaceae bacterium PLY_AMNH_Bact1]|nr:hypothetical protein QMT40_002488 [Parvibaculaceae bacterium PLY_AMNH_Bact1]
MKHTLAGFVAVASLVLPLGGVQAASDLSTDQLRSLNNDHTRIVRQAQRVCSVGSFSGVVRRGQNNGCIIGDVERHVRSVEDANILIFHQTLPLRYRYSSERSFGQVERYFH